MSRRRELTAGYCVHLKKAHVAVMFIRVRVFSPTTLSHIFAELCTRRTVCSGCLTSKLLLERGSCSLRLSGSSPQFFVVLLPFEARMIDLGLWCCRLVFIPSVVFRMLAQFTPQLLRGSYIRHTEGALKCAFKFANVLYW